MTTTTNVNSDQAKATVLKIAKQLSDELGPGFAFALAVVDSAAQVAVCSDVSPYAAILLFEEGVDHLKLRQTALDAAIAKAKAER